MSVIRMLLLIVVVVAPVRAAAQVPCFPDPSTVDFQGPFVRPAPLRGGPAVPFGVLITKQIIVRDCHALAIPNATVTLDFSLCSGPGPDQEFRLGASQPHHPGVLTNCAAKTVSAVTDIQGVATFRIVGGAERGPGSPPGYAGLPVASAGCVRVYADGAFIGRLVASAADQDLAGGMTPADVALIAGDRLAYLMVPGPSTYRARSDFDG